MWRRVTVRTATAGRRGRGQRRGHLPQLALFSSMSLVAALLAAVSALGTVAAPGAAAAPCPAGGCAVTISPHDLASGGALTSFSYVVNVDNTRLPNDPNPALRNGIAPTESNSPVVAEGDQSRAGITLPDGRYLVSVRSPDHKMWGKHVTLPQDAGTVRIDMSEASLARPLPLGKIRVFAFEDDAWTNGAPDTEEAGLAGFTATLEEQTNSAVTVDYHNNPLCGGRCRTAADGFVEIDNLGPATYFVYVTPPTGPCNSNPNSAWYQTTTIDGGLGLQAGVEEGSDGTGAPGEQLWEPPNRRTAYWFGFVCSPRAFSTSGTGRISGTARNWQGWPPFDVLTMGEPVANPFVALSNSATDRTAYVGQGDGQGNFTISNVPTGSYNLAIWDEQLSYIIRFQAVTVAPGQSVNVNETDSKGEVGIGVSRWFGWLDGTVYKDTNQNGVRDPGEPAIPNTDVDQRWRDGSIKESTVTDPSGYYNYPTAEGGPLGKWIIGEQGFTRFGVTGAAVHDEHTGVATHVPSDQGGNLLTNQLLTEGHRATVDWGKYDYPTGTAGQIVGITYWATTRNEFDARMAAHEDYEPALPDVTVNLEGPGPDGQPDTADDVVLNQYVTDHWQHPNAAQGGGQACAVRDANGNDISNQLNPQIGPKCLEVPITGEQTKDGAFDGGYAFASYCPDGLVLDADGTSAGRCNDGSDPDAHPLVAGTYLTHVLMPRDGKDSRPCNPANTSGLQNISEPKNAGVGGGGVGCLFRPEREEDVNVDLGAQFRPAVPPPPCIGDDHVIDQSTLTSRSPYFGVAGAHAPLCDKRLVVLQNAQNANADFFLMTNFPTGPDVQQPGRIIGLVSDDIYFERNPQSIWYGEPRPIANIPVGIRDYSFRLLTTVTTSTEGTYEALLPSTETLNCPIPQGPCPGMYLVTVNDPGDKGHPNPNYNPNLLTATSAWDVWPGLTDQLDTPLDPISGTGCETPSGQPQLLQVSKPYVRSTDTGAARQITISGDFLGTTPGSVTLTDPRGATQSRTLTTANGGIASWTANQAGVPDRIVINVPLTGPGFLPGQRQLSIKAATGQSTTSGITVHVLGSSGAAPYNPVVVNVAPPPPGPGTNPHAIQNAVDNAAPGSLLVLSPGVYNENVVLWKPVKLQGLGVGGIVGAHELQSTAPEDPRFGVKGTVIDGRFFQDNAPAYDATVSRHAPYAGVDATHPVLRGADVTVLAKNATAYAVPSGPTGVFSAARIDGVGLTTGRGDGAGGVQLQAHADNTQITNDFVENNGGIFGGGIGLGAPYNHDNHNYNVAMKYDQVVGNGGLTRSGGIGIFYGSNGYEIAGSIVCSNFGVEYGAGISHWGLSPGGRIHDNQIYYNDAVDSGAGISIQTEQPVGGGLGAGSGAVDIDRNLVQSNYTGDDGGGIFVLDARTAVVNIRNNQIVDNGAADIGGAVTLDDAANVRLVNNTVANNVSTGSSESSDGKPHSAGLAAEANDPLFQATLPAGAPDFSRPQALFNNIFWNNQAFTLSQPGPGATLVSRGFIDFEVHGTTNNADTFTPRYSDLTNGQALRPDGTLRTLPANQGNVVGQDPGFVTPFTLELTVTGSRLDPQTAAVTITGADPPVGLTGDYHLLSTSTMVDRGVRCSNTASPAPATALNPCVAPGVQAPVGTVASGGQGDFDGEYRPMQRVSTATRTPWDLGADELAGTQVTLP